MKTLFSQHWLLFLLVVGSAHGQENLITTNVPASVNIPTPPITLYLTDNERTGFHSGGPGRIEIGTGAFLEAAQSSESWPAEQDPEGHWGTAVKGYQVSLRFAQTVFTNGQEINATVLLRNVSDKTLGFPLIRNVSIPSYGGIAENFEFVVIGPDGKQLEGMERKPVSPHYLQIWQGTQKKFSLSLTNEFKFEIIGKYRIQAKTLADGSGRLLVTSGEAVIEVVKRAEN